MFIREKSEKWCVCEGGGGPGDGGGGKGGGGHITFKFIKLFLVFSSQTLFIFKNFFLSFLLPFLPFLSFFIV